MRVVDQGRAAADDAFKVRHQCRIMFRSANWECAYRWRRSLHEVFYLALVPEIEVDLEVGDRCIQKRTRMGCIRRWLSCISLFMGAIWLVDALPARAVLGRSAMTDSSSNRLFMPR